MILVVGLFLYKVITYLSYNIYLSVYMKSDIVKSFIQYTCLNNDYERVLSGHDIRCYRCVIAMA